MELQLFAQVNSLQEFRNTSRQPFDRFSCDRFRERTEALERHQTFCNGFASIQFLLISAADLPDFDAARIAAAPFRYGSAVVRASERRDKCADRLFGYLFLGRLAFLLKSQPSVSCAASASARFFHQSDHWHRMSTKPFGKTDQSFDNRQSFVQHLQDVWSGRNLHARQLTGRSFDQRHLDQCCEFHKDCCVSILRHKCCANVAGHLGARFPSQNLRTEFLSDTGSDDSSSAEMALRLSSKCARCRISR